VSYVVWRVSCVIFCVSQGIRVCVRSCLNVFGYHTHVRRLNPAGGIQAFVTKLSMGLLDKLMTRLDFYVPPAHLRSYVFLPHRHCLNTVARSLKFLVPPPPPLDVRTSLTGRHGGRTRRESISDGLRGMQAHHATSATHQSSSKSFIPTPPLDFAAAAGTEGVDEGVGDPERGVVGRETRIAIPVPPPSFAGGCDLRHPLAVDPQVSVYSTDTLAMVIDVALVLAAAKPRPNGVPVNYEALEWSPGITAAGLIVGLQTAIKKIGFPTTVAYLNRLEALTQCTGIVSDMIHVVTEVCEARVNGVLVGLRLPHTSHPIAATATAPAANTAASTTISPRRLLPSSASHRETHVPPIGAAVTLAEARRQAQIAARSFQVSLIKWRIMLAAAGRCHVMMTAVLHGRDTRAAAAEAAALAAAALAAHPTPLVEVPCPATDASSSESSDGDDSDSEQVAPPLSSPRANNPGKDTVLVPGPDALAPPTSLLPTSPVVVVPRCKQSGDPATFIGPPWKSTVTVLPPVLASRLLSLTGMTAAESKVEEHPGNQSSRHALKNMVGVLLSEQERVRAAKQAAAAIKGSRRLRVMERIQRLQHDMPPATDAAAAAATAHAVACAPGRSAAPTPRPVDAQDQPMSVNVSAPTVSSTVFTSSSSAPAPPLFPITAGSGAPSAVSSARSSRVNSRTTTPVSRSHTPPAADAFALDLPAHGRGTDTGTATSTPRSAHTPRTDASGEPSVHSTHSAPCSMPAVDVQRLRQNLQQLVLQYTPRGNLPVPPVRVSGPRFRMRISLFLWIQMSDS
jgi:hypothetical protein